MIKRFFITSLSYILAIFLCSHLPDQTARASEQISDFTLPQSPPVPKPSPVRKLERSPTQPKQNGTSERIYQVACPALMHGDVDGEITPPIESENCSINSPFRIRAIGKVNPIRFDQPVTINCAMATSLARWSEEVKIAAAKTFGKSKKISSVGTGSDYQCRNVNSSSGGRVSEHAFANALDIMSFSFTDGTCTHLETGWNGSVMEKSFWREVHKASCVIFMTVIGPDGDEAHKTNMHLDQGCHGDTCLATICQ